MIQLHPSCLTNLRPSEQREKGNLRDSWKIEFEPSMLKVDKRFFFFFPISGPSWLASSLLYNSWLTTRLPKKKERSKSSCHQMPILFDSFQILFWDPRIRLSSHPVCYQWRRFNQCHMLNCAHHIIVRIKSPLLTFKSSQTNRIVFYLSLGSHSGWRQKRGETSSVWGCIYIHPPAMFSPPEYGIKFQKILWKYFPWMRMKRFPESASRLEG